MLRERRERPVRFPRENHDACGTKLALAGSRAVKEKVPTPRGKRSVRSSAQVK